MRLILTTIVSLLLASLPALLPAAAPVADMHLHYKWSQQEVTSAAAAIELNRPINSSPVMMRSVI